MARTGSEENSAAQKQDKADQQTAFNTGQGAIAQTEQNTNTLAKGGQVAANPYLNPTYLSAVNKLQAGSLDANNNAAATALRQANLRSGGMNNTSTNGAIQNIALQKMRLGDTLSAGRTAEDWQKNIGYQQQMAQAPLAIAGAESPYYGTATTGQDSVLGNMTQEGIAAYGPWMAGIQAAGGAASAGITACPARGSLYLMADGSEKLVEDLREGDLVAGIEGVSQTIDRIERVALPILRVITDNGCVLRNSFTHCYILAKGGFTLAVKALGKTVNTRFGPSQVVSVEGDGIDEVFSVLTDGSHTYQADGVWAFGVRDAESDAACEQYLEEMCELTAGVK